LVNGSGSGSGEWLISSSGEAGSVSGTAEADDSGDAALKAASDSGMAPALADSSAISGSDRATAYHPPAASAAWETSDTSSAER
jgi:hypothetical protein